MTKDELTAWAVSAGWLEMNGSLCLTKPSRPTEAIVRMQLKGTVVQLEFKKPVGKWEKIASVPYAKVEPDDDGGPPRGLGFETMSGFSQLLEDNKNRAIFARLNARPKED